MIFGFYISRAICHLLGFLYPAYKSFKALERKNDELNKHFVRVIRCSFRFMYILFGKLIPFIVLVDILGSVCVYQSL